MDWDIHHGDGTYYIFEEDKNVLFFSLHRYDEGAFYPGESGDAKNIGKGPGKGYSIHIPWNVDYE